MQFPSGTFGILFSDSLSTFPSIEGTRFHTVGLRVRSQTEDNSGSTEARRTRNCTLTRRKRYSLIQLPLRCTFTGDYFVLIFLYFWFFLIK